VDYRERRPASVADIAGQAIAPINLTIDGSPRRVYALIVTGNYFELLGVPPALGRGFLPEEDRTPGQVPVIVFSEPFWRSRLGADPGIVGKAVTVNNQAFTVVGIAAPGFRGAMPHLAADAFVPMMMQAAVRSGDNKLTNRFEGWLQPVVKLAPGVTRERGQADMQAVVRQVRADHDIKGEGSIRLSEPWRSSDVTVAVTSVIGAQLAVALIVLLIACANVASLLLARAAGGQKETALRLSLGAGRLRLIQQVLVESTLLAIGGGVAGWPSRIGPPASSRASCRRTTPHRVGHIARRSCARVRARSHCAQRVRLRPRAGTAGIRGSAGDVAEGLGGVGDVVPIACASPAALSCSRSPCRCCWSSAPPCSCGPSGTHRRSIPASRPAMRCWRRSICSRPATTARAARCSCGRCSSACERCLAPSPPRPSGGCRWA
jgi:hypothetical protein